MLTSIVKYVNLGSWWGDSDGLDGDTLSNSGIEVHIMTMMFVWDYKICRGHRGPHVIIIHDIVPQVLWLTLCSDVPDG